jgi:hypothetical protein
MVDVGNAFLTGVALDAVYKRLYPGVQKFLSKIVSN